MKTNLQIEAKAPAIVRPANHNNVYQIITDRIIKQLEAGVAPWRKPWNAKTSFPRNLVSGRPYRGINVFLLLSGQYQSPFWMTFKQAAERGGNVRRGEHATPVIFWKRGEVEDTETGEKFPTFLLRYYSVFNVAQVEGITDAPTNETETTTPAETIIDQMPTRPPIKHGFRQAFYDPQADTVNLPNAEMFNSKEHYFSTAFHELIHATGHQSRLNRHEAGTQFGSESYSKEELIAEMGAAFLCGHAGIAETTLDNSAAYLGGWIQRLKSEPRLIISAAAAAQKAADYILGVKPAEPATEAQA